MREANPKINVRCEACGFTLTDFPAVAKTLPLRCPKCGETDCWKEERPRLYIPLSAARNIRR